MRDFTASMYKNLAKGAFAGAIAVGCGIPLLPIEMHVFHIPAMIVCSLFTVGLYAEYVRAGVREDAEDLAARNAQAKSTPLPSPQ